MKRVLLVVDNPHREMRGLVAVWLRLWKKGIFAHIASKKSFNDWYALLQPDAIVVPRATAEFKPFLEAKVAETEIVVIPSEHGNGFEQKVHNNAFGPGYATKGETDSAIELASLLLVGGANQKRWIAAASPHLSDKIHAVGTLSSDHWLKPRQQPSVTGAVGVCTTFKSLLLSIWDKSVHSVIYEHLSPDYRANAWRLGIQDFELHYLASIFEATDKMLANGFAVDVRPHPHEYWPGWQQWQKRVGRKVSINRQVDLAGWIDSKIACITSFSTTSIDCIARGVPSISLENLVAEQARRLPSIKEPLKGDFSWQVSTLDELIKLLERARKGELEVSPDLHGAQTFMRDNFNWPRDVSCATLCADAIEQLINKSSKKRRRTRRDYVELPFRALKILAKDIRDFFGPRRANLLFTFSIKMWIDACRFNRDITH